MKAVSISIPSPCHEDWNKMTPDAKGAFCASCQKSVYDFSDKTDEEIIDVFEKEEKGKVCGRFAPSQLSRPVISFGNETQSGRLAKFVCALLLVFGSFLFNGLQAYRQDLNVKGDVKVEMMGKPDIRTLHLPMETKDTTAKACGIKISTDEFIVPPVTATFENTSSLTGLTVIEVAPPDTIALDVFEIKEEVLPISVETYVVGGAMSVETGWILREMPADSSIVEELPEEPKINVFPNPNIGEMTLSYHLESRMPVKIELFDISGKLVRTLSQQANQYPGNYNVSYTIADLDNGVYNVVLSTGERRLSGKVVLEK